jgi:hypothetical protein
MKKFGVVNNGPDTIFMQNQATSTNTIQFVEVCFFNVLSHIADVALRSYQKLPSPVDDDSRSVPQSLGLKPEFQPNPSLGFSYNCTDLNGLVRG